MRKYNQALYRGQWERLLDDTTVSQIKAFIAANSALLTTKD